jgi:dTMP kinase
MPLIVLEGIDGCGKSTQAERLASALTARGTPPVRQREPGGTRLGEKVRALLLDSATEACPVAELFGYLTARAQLCHSVLAPALAEGRWVLMDRFWPSTIAYQAYGLGLDPVAVRASIDLALGGVRMDVGVWFDLDPVEAARRRALSRSQEDRIEARGLAYLNQVASGYAALASEGVLTRIDASGDPDAVFTRLESLVFATKFQSH